MKQNVQIFIYTILWLIRSMGKGPESFQDPENDIQQNSRLVD
jgi:hypothetical protein